jgi:putative SOS response-associated peptidase YedK
MSLLRIQYAEGGLGLWDAWKDGQGHRLQSFSIVTTEANERMSSVHTHMPLILHKRDYDRWLSRKVTEAPPINLLRPFESEDIDDSGQPARRKRAEQWPGDAQLA